MTGTKLYGKYPIELEASVTGLYILVIEEELDTFFSDRICNKAFCFFFFRPRFEVIKVYII